MRLARITRPPRPAGRGASVWARRLAAVAVLAVAMAQGPASAAPVTVRFGISVGAPTPLSAFCPVRVPAGADGLAVLDAARARRCILSYRAEYYPGLGHYIRCIDGICAIDRPVFLAYWAMFENGRYTSYGVDGFRANAGDRLVFVYTR
jgi:hypothetical protein